MLKAYVADYREQLGNTVGTHLVEFTKTVSSPDPKRWTNGYSFLNQMKNAFVESASKGDEFATKQFMESHRGWFVEYGKQYFKSAYGHIKDNELLFKSVVPHDDLAMFKFSNMAITMGNTESGFKVTLIARYDLCIDAVKNPDGPLISAREFEMLQKHTLPKDVMEALLNIKQKSPDLLVFKGRNQKGDLILDKIENANKDFMFDWMMTIPKGSK